MLLRICLFFIMAAGLVGFGTVAWISTRPPAQAAAASPPMVAVLTAAHSIRAGTLLKPGDFASRQVPRTAIPAGAELDTAVQRSAIVGGMVRRTLSTGDLLAPTDLTLPGDHGFLAAVMSPGMRAATVAVDAVSGSAGLIWPGDRVDLILIQAIEGAAVPLGHRIASETVVTDARVIAVDQDLVQGATPGAESKQARTATLEVTPADAERIAVASRLGHLSLVVRASEPATAAGGGARATSVMWASDVSPALGQPAATPPAVPEVVHVYAGAADPKDFKF